MVVRHTVGLEAIIWLRIVILSLKKEIKKNSFYTYFCSHKFTPFNGKDEAQLSGGILGWITQEADSEARIFLFLGWSQWSQVGEWRSKMEMAWKPTKCTLMTRLLTCEQLGFSYVRNLCKMVFYIKGQGDCGVKQLCLSLKEGYFWGCLLLGTSGGVGFSSWRKFLGTELQVPSVVAVGLACTRIVNISFFYCHINYPHILWDIKCPFFFFSFIKI